MLEVKSTHGSRADPLHPTETGTTSASPSGGKAITRRVEVSNGTHTPMQVTLYSGAATLEHGKFLGSAGHQKNDMSGWTTMEPAQLELEPRRAQWSR